MIIYLPWGYIYTDVILCILKNNLGVYFIFDTFIPCYTMIDSLGFTFYSLLQYVIVSISLFILCYTMTLEKLWFHVLFFATMCN